MACTTVTSTTVTVVVLVDVGCAMPVQPTCPETLTESTEEAVQ